MIRQETVRAVWVDIYVWNSFTKFDFFLNLNQNVSDFIVTVLETQNHINSTNGWYDTNDFECYIFATRFLRIQIRKSYQYRDQISCS